MESDQVHAKPKALPQGSRMKSQNNLIACPKERKFHQNLILVHKNKLKVPSPIYSSSIPFAQGKHHKCKDAYDTNNPTFLNKHTSISSSRKVSTQICKQP
jgi:hypothetical protein